MHVLESTLAQCAALLLSLALGACADQAGPRGGPIAREAPVDTSSTDGAPAQTTGGTDATPTDGTESTTGATSFTTSGYESYGSSGGGGGTSGGNTTRINCECQCQVSLRTHYIDMHCSADLFRYTVANQAACTALNGTVCRAPDGQRAWERVGTQCRRGSLNATHHSCRYIP